MNGTITNWQIGDVIVMRNTHVSNVHERGDTLTVTYGSNQTANYVLADKQPDTLVSFQSDGHGGTELILTPIIGVQQQRDASHPLLG